jgi:hypothetical protein
VQPVGADHQVESSARAAAKGDREPVELLVERGDLVVEQVLDVTQSPKRF